MRIKSSLISMAFIALMVASSATASTPPTNSSKEAPSQRDARMKWWREARFGMFIHWGLYSVPGGIWNGIDTQSVGDRIMSDDRISVAQYAALAKQFDPKQFDADSWVNLAKSAGMKYIVVTAKYHDGFAMYRSKVDSYKIFDATPFHRDPLKELAVACKKKGIKFGVYYSQNEDWYHPGGNANSRQNWDPAQSGNHDDYLKNVAVPQVKELLTNYGPVSVIWWDEGGYLSPAQSQLFAPLLRLQPRIISNDRLGSGLGDFGIPQNFIPPPDRVHDWETFMNINGTWGYKSGNQNYRSSADLLHNLIKIASNGGNYLLNVGPDANGVIPPDEAQRLLEVGKWLSANGEAIYGTTASPFNSQLDWAGCTFKKGKLYLSVFTWPKDGKLHLPLLNSSVHAYLMTAPQAALGTSTDSKGLTIEVPKKAPDRLATVIVVDPHGSPQFLPPPPPAPTITADSRGGLDLAATNAILVGDLITTVGLDQKYVGFWNNVQDYITWHVKVEHAGTYRVIVDYAADPEHSDAEFTFGTSSQSLAGIAVSTGGLGDYKTVNLGSIVLNQIGEVLFSLKALKAPHGYVMNLRTIHLVPSSS